MKVDGGYPGSRTNPFLAMFVDSNTYIASGGSKVRVARDCTPRPTCSTARNNSMNARTEHHSTTTFDCAKSSVDISRSAHDLGL